MVSIIIGIAAGALILGIICYVLFSALSPLVFIGVAIHDVYRHNRPKGSKEYHAAGRRKRRMSQEALRAYRESESETNAQAARRIIDERDARRAIEAANLAEAVKTVKAVKR